MTRNRTTTAGFTLTEVMIALAMTALLLIGISKIFALTSATISTGQAAAKAMRSQRAIQQAMSGDLIGVGSDLGGSTYSSGMLPLVNFVDAGYAAPYLTISNFRVAAYRNPADMASDAVAASDLTQTSAITTSQFVSRSAQIRGNDLNKDGVEDATSITAGGETIPLYFYGDRNFRCDTVGFFTKGRFQSQTGSATSFVSPVMSSESFVWYGHLRTFNSDTSSPSRFDYSNAYGAPGDWLIPGSSPALCLPNRNDRFADQFRLGRMQSLLVDSIPAVGGNSIESSVTAENTTAVNAQGVFAGNDPTKPVMFVQRNWWSPIWKPTIGTPPARPTMTPLSFSSSVRLWANLGNRQVYSDDRASGTTPAPVSTIAMQAISARTDVIGVGVKRLRERARFTSQNDLSDPLTSSSQSYWWEELPTSWTQRYYVNPFARTSQFDTSGTAAINSKSMSQRQQLLSESCTQFIVEYAGDFVKQNADGTIDTSTDDTSKPLAERASHQPDGVLDYAVVNNVRQTRWYGMPRDVDGDGHIYGSGAADAAIAVSPDVIPLSDFAGSRQPLASRPVPRLATDTDITFQRKLGASFVYTFERSIPPAPAGGDYALAVSEPSGSTSPDSTSYVCVWGPLECQPNPVGSNRYAVPQLLRIITDVRDPDGKMKDAMTQEYVFPVRVTGSVAPPTTP